MMLYSFVQEGYFSDGLGRNSLRKAQENKAREISMMSSQQLLAINPNSKKVQKIAQMADNKDRYNYIRKNIMSRPHAIRNAFVPVPFYSTKKQFDYMDQARRLKSQSTTQFLQGLS